MTWETFFGGITLGTAVDMIYTVSGTAMHGYDNLSWRVLPSPATSVENGSAVVYEKEIYVAGRLAAFRKYSPATNQWTILSSCWVDAAFSSLEVIDGFLYLVGGNNPPHNQLHRYDPATDTWILRAPCPNSAYNAVTAVFRGCLYVLGNDGILSIYNPRHNLWESRQAELPNAQGAAAVTVGDSAIIVGAETPFIQYTPSTRFVNQIVAAVKAGQTVNYSAANGVAVLRLGNSVLPQGETTAAANGNLITAVTDNAADIIRGWVK
jgi:hypothetical protein